jgi:hypothetical protein
VSFKVSDLNETEASRVEITMKANGSSATLELDLQASGVLDLAAVVVALDTSSVVVSTSVTVVLAPTSAPSPAPTTAPSSSPSSSNNSGSGSGSSSSSKSRSSSTITYIIIAGCLFGGIPVIGGVFLILLHRRKHARKVQGRKGKATHLAALVTIPETKKRYAKEDVLSGHF